MTSDADARSANQGARRLTRYYILALSAVALLSLTGQALVQSRLLDQLGDSRLVNVAGRQRMLSQRIVKCALLLQSPAEPAVRAARLEELRRSTANWKRLHDELRRGDVAGGNSPEAAAIFAKVEAPFVAMSTAAERIASSSEKPRPDDVAVLIAGEATFLDGMDAIVAQYERDAQTKVARLRTLEWVLLGLTLATLLLEGLYVFRPAVAQIRRSMAALVRLGEELRSARDVAESANRAKSQFLANVSHELRTPLHAVLGGVEMAQRSLGDSGPAARRSLEALCLIDDSARRQLSLVNDLLDLAKIEAGKLSIADESFDLHQLLERTAAMFRPLADAQGLRFDVDLAADLPRCVRGDALRVGEVLTNLLGNALKFTPAGEIRLRAYVRRGLDDARELRCVVRDTGIGIAEDQQRRIFESFAQVDAAGDRMRQGAGLGLAVSRQLAELMRGRLEVESRLGAGSTFVFAWPCVEGVAAEITDDRAPSVAGNEVRCLSVLAVDDTAAGRRVLEAMLAELGHRPTCVAEGHAAIAAFESGEFDVVLLDLHMPTLDGRTTAAAIRAVEQARRLPRTPIWLVTADATSDARATGHAGDFDGALLKPFSQADLGRALGDAAAATEAHASSSPRERALARLNNDEALLGELVELFLQEAPRRFEELRRSIAAGSAQGTFQVAHLLHGQLKMLEHPGAELFLELEDAARLSAAERQADVAAQVELAWPGILDDVRNLLPIQRP